MKSGCTCQPSHRSVCWSSFPLGTFTAFQKPSSRRCSRQTVDRRGVSPGEPEIVGGISYSPGLTPFVWAECAADRTALTRANSNRIETFVMSCHFP